MGEVVTIPGRPQRALFEHTKHDALMEQTYSARIFAGVLDRLVREQPDLFSGEEVMQVRSYLDHGKPVQRYRNGEQVP